MADTSTRVLLVVGEAAGGIRRHVDLLVERLPMYGVDVVVAMAGARGLRGQVREADVVHAHGLRATARAALAGGARSLLVSTWHNAPLVTGPRRVAHDLASRFAARRADLTLGASPDLTAAARSAGAREARDTFVVAPPMPPPARSPQVVRAELELDDRPMVLAVGRLQAQKRLDVLVSAAGRWAGRSGSPVVVVAGAGPDEAPLRAQIAATDAPVRLLGARDDVPDLLAAADLVALPSVWEARSFVAQEALRAGVPLVTTPVGGLPDLVGDAAVMVPVGDAGRLGDAIDRLLGDAELRQRLAEAGRARASTWPTVQAMTESLATTYRELLTNRRVGGAS